MADDLDGVSVSSSVPQYNPGPQYRVKEMDPDEAGGGKDFYDGFLRKKKKDSPEGEEEEKNDADAETVPTETPANPVPTVERDIHDDVILSLRAKKMLDQEHAEDQQIPPPVEPKKDDEKSPTVGHISFQA